MWMNLIKKNCMKNVILFIEKKVVDAIARK